MTTNTAKKSRTKPPANMDTDESQLCAIHTEPTAPSKPTSLTELKNIKPDADATPMDRPSITVRELLLLKPERRQIVLLCWNLLPQQDDTEDEDELQFLEATLLSAFIPSEQPSQS